MAEKSKKKKLSKLIIARNVIYFLLLLLFNFALFIKFKFHNVGFEQLLFTLTNTEGANFDVVYQGILFVLLTTLGELLLIFGIKKLFKFLKMRIVVNVGIKSKKINKIFSFDIFKITKLKQVCLFIIIFILGIYIPIDMIDFTNYFRAQKVKTSFFEDYYVNPVDVDIKFEGDKKNLIYIYVESLESSNVSIKNGGVVEKSYVPNLERLALDNINFSNTSKIGGAVQVSNTTWTVAGLIAQNAGVPLKIPISANSYKEYSSSLPGAYGLGEVLEKNGYKNYFMLGSDSSYGGRKDYFLQHGNYEIFDHPKAIEEKYIPNDYDVWWGYEDKKLFEFSKKKLLEISKNDEPFNFTILTADTHFTDGYMDSSCKEVFDEAYANSFYCSDSKIGEFIRWIKKQDFYNDTTIVITGDHLTMQEDFYEEDVDDKRYIYNAFINSSVTTNNSKNRTFTAFDLYPTTLAAMGATIDGNKLGLGVNLFSDEKTLIEMFGKEELNKQLVGKSEYYNQELLGDSYYEMLDDVEDKSKLDE